MSIDISTLPQAVDAERTLLGSVLVDNRILWQILESLAVEDFHREAHRRIFLAMSAMSEKSEPIDLVTLKNELLRTTSLEAAGGVAYIAGLVEGVPRLENAAAWIAVVKDASIKRQIIRAADAMAQKATDSEDDSDSVLDSAERSIFSIADKRIKSGLVQIRTFLKDTFESIEKSATTKGAITGIPSGFIDLDRMTRGFQPTDLIIVAARPAMGKTSLAMNIARHASRRAPVAVFSMEMSKEQIVKRLIFSEARVDSSIVSRGQAREDDWNRLAVSWNELNSLPIFIDEASSITPMELKAKCRRMRDQYGLGLVIVDYLQLMSAGVRTENRQNEVAAISRSLKALAKDMAVPVIALSQLSRDLEKRADKRPQLSDLRESGSLEQEADIVLFLYRECVYTPTPENAHRAELIVSKHRNGPDGIVNLNFEREFTRFDNAAIIGFED